MTELEHWLLLGDDVVLDALRRCHAGEDPDAVLAELWANARHLGDVHELEELDAAHAHLNAGGVVVISLTPDA